MTYTQKREAIQRARNHITKALELLSNANDKASDDDCETLPIEHFENELQNALDEADNSLEELETARTEQLEAA